MIAKNRDAPKNESRFWKSNAVFKSLMSDNEWNVGVQGGESTITVRKRTQLSGVQLRMVTTIRW